MNPIHSQAPAGAPRPEHNLFDGAGDTLYREGGQEVDLQQLVNVVVRPGNRWKTPDREYLPGDLFQVTLGELASSPLALQSEASWQAELARQKMLAPQQQAAQERAESVRRSVEAAQRLSTSDEEHKKIEARRLVWMRDQARKAHTRGELDRMIANQEINEEVYYERLAHLAPEVPAQQAHTLPAQPIHPPMQKQIEERLRMLKALFDQNLIAPEEWRRRQAEILAEI